MPALYLSFDVGIRNLAFCMCERDASQKLSVVRWENVDLRSVGDATVTDSLLTVLDDIVYGPGGAAARVAESAPERLDLRVLVENQPCRGSKMMAVVQVYLEAYFKTVKMYHTQMAFRVNVVSPRNKSIMFLNQQQRPSGAIRGGRGRNIRYRSNKTMSIDAIQQWLAQNPGMAPPEKAQLFASRPRGIKLDDLADCLLQLLAYLEVH